MNPSRTVPHAFPLQVLSQIRQYPTRSIDEELWNAAGVGHAARVIELLSNGANPNYNDVFYPVYRGQRFWYSFGTPLFQSARYGHLSTLRILIDFGADPKIRELRCGSTPLLRAARMGHLQCVRELLQSGSDVDERDWFGETALFKAAACGQLEMVRFLITAGSDLGVKNLSGNNLMIRPLHEGYAEVADEFYWAMLSAGYL